MISYLRISLPLSSTWETGNLRDRLIYKYSKDGSSIKNHLRPFLLAGFYVYFRWANLATEADALAKEKEILDLFDYPFNLEHNVAARLATKVGWEYEIRIDGKPNKKYHVSVLGSIQHCAQLLQQELEEEQQQAQEDMEATQLDDIQKAIMALKLSDEQRPIMEKILKAMTTLPTVTMSENIKTRLRSAKTK